MSAAADTRRLHARREPGADGAATRSLVLGMGATGGAFARWLAGRGGRAVFADSREAPPALAEIHALLPETTIVPGELEDPALLNGVDRVLVSPGIAAGHPLLAAARERGLPVLSDIDVFVAEAAAPIVGVTGSNGKSTVVSLLAAMCEAAGLEVRAGGNLGPPALDLLAPPQPGYFLLELSSFQLELSDAVPLAAAALLNLSPDHLDRHPDLDSYRAAKRRVYADAGIAIVNRDQPELAAGVHSPRGQIGFGLGIPAEGDFGLRAAGGRRWLARGAERLLPADELRLAGEHNIANVLAALALAAAIDLPLATAVRAAACFAPLPHRAERVGAGRGIAFVDDSKATNVGAAAAAAAGMPGPLVLIAGGDGKGADFAPLGEALAGKLRAAVVLGRDAGAIARVLAPLAPVREAADMDEAVALAAGTARAGDTVLLAPACASTDMFEDYRARGDAFRAAVKRWLA